MSAGAQPGWDSERRFGCASTLASCSISTPRWSTAAGGLAAWGVDPSITPVVTRDHVKYAKPDLDRFLAASERLGWPIETTIVVGDSIWDMLFATFCHALGVGVLSGSYGAEELRQAGAIRVDEDPADLLVHLGEVGGRR